MDETQHTLQQKNSKPQAKFTAGAVSAAVWTNDIQGKGSFNTVSISRSYKDKAGNWKTTATLRVNDLPKARLVLDKAFEHLTTNSSEESATA